MHSIISSAFAVSFAEIGDKTQLLIIMLASIYRKPVPIILGVIVATVFSHLPVILAGKWLGVAP